MGMGYGANCAFVIKKESIIAKTCPEAFAKLMEAIKADEEVENIDNLAQQLYFDSIAEDDNLFIAYTALLKDFAKQTELSIELGWHDREECGDRYDEIDGSYWAVVDGMFELTPAGKKFEKSISLKQFVTFG